MLNKLQNFMGIRQSITLLLTFVFCYLSVTGKVSNNDFLSIFTMVVGVYFGHSIAIKGIDATKGE